MTEQLKHVCVSTWIHNTYKEQLSEWYVCYETSHLCEILKFLFMDTYKMYTNNIYNPW